MFLMFHEDFCSELHVRTDLESRGDDSLTVRENLWPVGSKGPQTHVVESSADLSPQSNVRPLHPSPPPPPSHLYQNLSL